ncbi:hypothetical protein [Paenibacillus aceris]|uniref:Uncharacterized protein n=1 Tax=Paenibacillus aceris TaxID=869555 RepID=A0ABS4I0H5_9BACL|nr:hypothetical protein [Paenibacillus aceris]MBP1964061.1 hypothetical protein [Paenibacillus aceris]NHW34524.1 hypothetical protein [Paenibacillus aceris]
MVLVIFLVIVWFSIHLFAALPNKLPLITNVLLYMILSIIDINRITIISNDLGWYQISTRVPQFLSVILHRDFTYCLTLLTFANVYLTASKRLTKVIISLYTFTFLFLCSKILRWTGAIIDLKWNFIYECITLLSMMFLAYWLGRWLRYMKRKEMSA